MEPLSTLSKFVFAVLVGFVVSLSARLTAVERRYGGIARSVSDDQRTNETFAFTVRDVHVQLRAYNKNTRRHLVARVDALSRRVCELEEQTRIHGDDVPAGVGKPVGGKLGGGELGFGSVGR